MSSQAEASVMNHFSHEHPLKLSNHQNIPTCCSGCKSPATAGMIYCCRACDYFLHPGCAKLPRQITHPFDKGHVFTLRSYGDGLYNYCDACGKAAKGFCYHCKICKIDLHAQCATMPLTFTHRSHALHQLKLLFSPTHHDKKFNCDVCNTPGSGHWLYRCDICDFDVHLHCRDVLVQPPPAKQAPPHAYTYQHHANFGAFPNQTPPPQAAHSYSQQQPPQPGIFASQKSAPEHHQVPPTPPPHYQYGPNFQPFNPPHVAPGVPMYNPGVDPALMHFIQSLQAQNRVNREQIQALIMAGAGGRTGGVGGGGLQSIIQAMSGLSGSGVNVPGFSPDLLGNAAGGGGNIMDLLGGLDLGTLFGAFGLG